jgi:UDP-N-acetylglucosamine 2-epimerase (non-hydrolysing)
VIDTFQLALQARRNGQALASRNLSSKRLILVTTHRRENLGEPMKSICRALREIVTRSPTWGSTACPFECGVRQVVYPLLSGLDRLAYGSTLTT